MPAWSRWRVSPPRPTSRWTCASSTASSPTSPSGSLPSSTTRSSTPPVAGPPRAVGPPRAHGPVGRRRLAARHVRHPRTRGGRGPAWPAHIDTLDPRDESVVSGYGHRTGTWTRLPTVAELDAVSGQHPVVLISGDAHHGWLNSAALSLLGVPPRQTTLDENDWFPVFGRLGDLPGAGLAHKLALREVVRDAAARGVVGVTDLEFGGALPRLAGALRPGRRQPARPRRRRTPRGWTTWSPPGCGPGRSRRRATGCWQMGPLKIISDGSLNTRTAYCCDAVPRRPPAGVPAGPAQQLPRGAGRALHHRPPQRPPGRAARDRRRGAQRSGSTRSRRPAPAAAIEHAQLVDLADLPRMAELGVRASVQPAHLLDDRDVTERCWPERTHRCFAFRSMLDRRRRAGARLRRPGRGARPVAGDVRGRAPHRRRAGARGTPSRRSPPPRHWPPAPTASPRSGAGSRGDVVLLDHDPLAPYDDSGEVGAHLREVEVAATFVAGRPTHLAL